MPFQGRFSFASDSLRRVSSPEGADGVSRGNAACVGAGGRLILFEPYISLASYPVYGLFHHEPVAGVSQLISARRSGDRAIYYAAQGNATRLFFTSEFPHWPDGWNVFYAKAFSTFHYLLSGGYSKPAVYPAKCFDRIQEIDERLSHWPRVFGGRCLVGIDAGKMIHLARPLRSFTAF